MDAQGCAAEGCWKWEQAEIPAKFTMHVRLATLHIPFLLCQKDHHQKQPTKSNRESTYTPSSNTMEDAYVSNLDVELELLLRLPWPPKNKLSLARYLIGFSCSTVDGTSSNIILKWWYTMPENEQDPPFPIKSKQCRGCPGIFPFLKGLLAKGTSFQRGALNPKQKKHLQSSTTWSLANAHAVVAISHGFNLEVQGQSCWRSVFTRPDESVAMMRIPWSTWECS